MNEHVLDDAAHLIVWSVRRAIDFEDPTELHEGPAWLAARLAGSPLAADIVRLALREAVRVLEDEDEYARALALAAEFAAETTERLRRTAAA
ncbi:MAG TPA: hypothetical protein VH418_09390 [Solirubrobacteraceae bacterium]|jgi:hypothetical protein